MAVIFHWTRERFETAKPRKTDVIDSTIEYITSADTDAYAAAVVVILIVNNALVCASDKDPAAFKSKIIWNETHTKTQIHANVNVCKHKKRHTIKENYTN